MRMEELSDNRYIKNTDTVEKYLLNLIQEYFKNTNITSTTSREYIIQKAVERMKEEIGFENIGVLSITLPSGERRTGAVSISLEDLGGEPIISPKMTAFNVDFGIEQNTACEGNDPRLSDARKPLPHTHNVSDIVGLEGTLSSLKGKSDRLANSIHSHNNMDVLDKLIYNGTNTTIDLAVLETLNSNLDNIVNQIRDDVSYYRQEIDSKISDVSTEVSNTITQTNELNKVIVDKNIEYYNLSKEYTDNAIKISNDIITEEINNKLLVKNNLNPILNLVNNTYSIAGSSSFSLNSIIDFGIETNYQTAVVDIDSTILNEIKTRGQILQDCRIEYLIKYTDPNSGKIMYSNLPYILLHNNDLNGSLQIGVDYNSNQLLVSLNLSAFSIPDEIQKADIVYTIYSKQCIIL